MLPGSRESQKTWNLKALTEGEKLTFLSYQITCSVISNPTDAQVSDIFERLNKGKSLSDNDKFYNRKNEPIIKFIIDELTTKFKTRFENI